VDGQQTAFVETFRRFMEELILTPRPQVDVRTPVDDLVQDFLQTDVTILPMVTEDLATHRLVDADIALDELNAAPASSVFGVTAGQQRGHSSFHELTSSPFLAFAPGPVDYVSAATGPDTERRVVSFGVRLLTVDGHRVAVLQRGALDVEEECNIRCPARVVEGDPCPADGLSVGIDTSKNKHPPCLQPLGEELRVLVASTLQLSFSFPSTSNDLLDRVFLRARCFCHWSNWAGVIWRTVTYVTEL
jgi:hypothetical protein